MVALLCVSGAGVTPAARPSGRAPVFAALGDPTRLRLIDRLSGGRSLSIASLAHEGGVSRQAVAKHLRVLANAGLVRDQHQGREHLYRLEAAPLKEVAEWAEQFRAHWEASLDRLEDYLSTLQPQESPK